MISKSRTLWCADHLNFCNTMNSHSNLQDISDHFEYSDSMYQAFVLKIRYKVTTYHLQYNHGSKLCDQLTNL